MMKTSFRVTSVSIILKITVMCSSHVKKAHCSSEFSGNRSNRTRDTFSVISDKLIAIGCLSFRIFLEIRVASATTTYRDL